MAARRLVAGSVIAVACAVTVGVWAAASAGGQAPPAALPAELRAQIQKEQFSIVTSIRGLPLGVRGELEALFGTHSLDIAEPGAPFQASGVASVSRLPIRRLAAAGCSYEYCLVYYERGGSARTWRVALFHWTPDATRFEWGGNAPGNLASIEDVRRAVLSGIIEGPVESW